MFSADTRVKKIFPVTATSAIIVAQPDQAAPNLQPDLPSETNLDWGFGLNRTKAALDELRAGKTIMPAIYYAAIASVQSIRDY